MKNKAKNKNMKNKKKNKVLKKNNKYMLHKNKKITFSRNVNRFLY